MQSLAGYSDSEDDDEPVMTTEATSTDHLENVSDDAMQSGRANVTSKPCSPDMQARPHQPSDTALSDVVKGPTPSPVPALETQHGPDHSVTVEASAVQTVPIPSPALVSAAAKHTPAEEGVDQLEDQDEALHKPNSQFSENILMDDGEIDIDLPGGNAFYQKARESFAARSNANSRKSPRRDDVEDNAHYLKKTRRMGSQKRGQAPSDLELNDYESDADANADDEDAADTSTTCKAAQSSLFGGSKDGRRPQQQTRNSLFGDRNPAPNSIFAGPRQPPFIQDPAPMTPSFSHTTFIEHGLTHPQPGSDLRATELTFGIDDQEPSPRHAISLGLSDMHLNGSGNVSEDTPLGDRESDPDSYTFRRGAYSPSPSRSISPQRATGSQALYDLRRNIDREIKGSYIDYDKTGTFDPEEEERKRAAEKQKAKERRKRAKGPKLPAVKKPTKLIMRFKFPRLGYGHVRNQAFDGKLDANGNPVPSDTTGFFDENYGVLDDEEKQEQLERQERWRLLKIKEKIRRDDMRQRTPDVEASQQEPIIDTLKKENRKAVRQEDLTNHPEARGCKACREKNKVCSMRTGDTWPCELCDDEDECELFVLPPAGVMGKCNHCKADCEPDEDNFCSFEMEVHAPHYPCQQCEKARNPDCIPGIPEGFKHARVDLEELTYGPNRENVDCAICRADGKMCSIKTRGKRGPCTRCKKNGWGCTFGEKPSKEALQHLKHDKKGGFYMDAEEEQGADDEEEEEPMTPPPARPKPDNEVDHESYFNLKAVVAAQIEKPKPETDSETPMRLTDSKGRKGFHTKITTSFIHPINFMTSSPDAMSDSDTCDFCTDPMQAFIGMGEMDSDVIKWDNGLGYTDILPHDGVANTETYMCASCTMHRAQIVSCERHELTKFENGGKDLYDITEDLLGMESGDLEKVRLQLQYFCSLCFSLTEYRCCAMVQDLAGADGDEELVEGCGLTLCEGCARRLEAEFNFNLSGEGGMAEELDKQPKFKKRKNAEMLGVVRADVGLLAESGLLMKNVNSPDDYDQQPGFGVYIGGKEYMADGHAIRQFGLSSGFGEEWQNLGGRNGFIRRDEDTMECNF